jgi:hypothetical protein
MTMWIERINPAFVGAKSGLLGCLTAEGRGRGWSDQECEALLAIVPPALLSCACFLDRLTRIWRYEFGRPHQVGADLIWGTHMWAPVPVLFDVLVCARLRLPPDKLSANLKLLTAPEKHQEYLAEMFPVLRVDPAIPAQHEAAGRGAGNRTIDWTIGPVGGRTVRIDVKRRYADFIAQMGAPMEGAVPAPEHDPALLFRSVENKFVAADPGAVLQGAWIVTDIKQEAAEFEKAFSALDAEKVHFTVVGDHRPDIHLLTRREQDRPYLLDLFRAVPSERFVFSQVDRDVQATGQQTGSGAAATRHRDPALLRRGRQRLGLYARPCLVGDPRCAVQPSWPDPVQGPDVRGDGDVGGRDQEDRELRPQLLQACRQGSRSGPRGVLG